MINNLTFGSDPEYFVVNEKTGKIVSAIPIVEGTKENPEPLGDGYFIQKDNVLVEGNIPPVRTKAEFISVMVELKKRITDYIKAKYYVLGVRHEDCLNLDNAFLSHPEAMQFGCSPYFNAWDNESHRAQDLSSQDFRTCGFHSHVGYDREESTVWNKQSINIMLARAYDLFVIIPSCLTHVDRRRFENYGGLGQYRDTSYGLELRSLGGYFVDEKYLSWVFDQLEKTIEYVKDEENFYKLSYLSKPLVTFPGGIFTFESKPYNELDISFDDQLIKSKKVIYA
jgi:hypothetical protein